jgi:DNA polymerase/3'-5' exonuclease PolX
MGDKIKWPLATADWLAQVMIAELRPFVERIEVVGSVRRRKAEVGDVELLFIPKLQDDQSDMFTRTKLDLASEHLDHLKSVGALAKRKNIAGYDAGWGPKNKLAVFAGMPLDLFSTTGENWFVSLVIRTGGKENNLKLTTGAQKLNRTLHAYGAGVEDRKTGIVTPALSERQVFELCGCEYVEPQDRL